VPFVRGHLLVGSTLLLFTAWSQAARADWINLTGAENAPNIAEIYILDDRIRVQLEIFVDDISAFTPLTKEAFSAIQFRTENGERLEIIDIPVLERRFRQDRYSPFRNLGAAVPWATIIQPPEDKRVYYAELVFKLKGEPDTIVITPPTTPAGLAVSNIGMLVFHKNVPVIDFRYLSGSEILRLDWNDPWYTKFDNPNLSRHHQAALTSYLYIEPYEVRHEILIRPRDLSHWLNLQLTDEKYIQTDELKPLLERLGTFLLQRNRVTVDGKHVPPILYQAEFVSIGLYGIQTMTPTEKLELNSAVVGIMLSYPTPGMPQQVRMQWDLFNERIQEVPATAVDPAGPFISYLTPEDNTLVWNNFLKQYRLPEVERIPVKPGGSPGRAVLIAVLALALLLLVIARARHMRWTWPLGAALLVLMALGTLVTAKPLTRGLALKQLESKEAAFILESLLKNVYHAFYVRNDEDVYDKLALTVAGNLLEQVFLQQRRSFAVQSAGGAQAKVNAVELLESAYQSEYATSDSLVYEARWTATGAVSHWGHTHDRTNMYEALITISPSGDMWKIIDLKILNEERLMQSIDTIPVPNSG
jgi:hypothetical protein